MTVPNAEPGHSAGGPCCACLRVSYQPVCHNDGTQSTRWVCDSCGARFIPHRILEREMTAAEERECEWQESIGIYGASGDPSDITPKRATEYINNLVDAACLARDALCKFMSDRGPILDPEDSSIEARAMRALNKAILPEV